MGASKTPAWVWIVGIIVVGGGMLLVAAVAVFGFVEWSLYEKARHEAMVRDSYRRLAAVLAEPVYASADATTEIAWDYNSECVRVARTLQALEESPEDSRLRTLKAAAQPRALECMALLQRIGQVEQNMPDGWHAFLSALGTVDEADKVNKDAGLRKNMESLGRAWDASKDLRDRVSAEMDLVDLKGKYRTAKWQLIASARSLDDSFGGLLARSATRPGYVGINVISTNGMIVVTRVIPNSPAAKGGILVGETVLTVDQQDTRGMTLQQVLLLLRGPAGSAVNMELAAADGTRRKLGITREDLGFNNLVDDFDTSFNGCFVGDLLTLQNSEGRTLNDCLLLVTCKNSGQSVTHVHWIGQWDYGKRLYLSYPTGYGHDYQPYEAYEPTSEIEVVLESREMTDRAVYSYTAEERAADIIRYCNSLKFTGELVANGDGFLDSLSRDLSGRGASVKFGGLPRISPKRVKVTLQEGSGSDAKRVSLIWTGTMWSNGEERSFRDERFNPLRPDGFAVDLEFPYTTVTRRYTWGSANN